MQGEIPGSHASWLPSRFGLLLCTLCGQQSHVLSSCPAWCRFSLLAGWAGAEGQSHLGVFPSFGVCSPPLGNTPLGFFWKTECHGDWRS